jgi:hypothetical protein
LISLRFVMFQMGRDVETKTPCLPALGPDPYGDELSHRSTWHENSGWLSQQSRDFLLEVFNQITIAITIVFDAVLFAPVGHSSKECCGGGLDKPGYLVRAVAA